MGAMRSARRARFEEEIFPHLESLWRTALWLTMRRGQAEELVTTTVTQAYRSWQDFNGSFSQKAGLFKILTIELLGAADQRRQRGWFLPEHCEASADRGGHCLQQNSPPLEHQELSSLTGINDGTIKGAITRLRVPSRLIMILLFCERFSYADIAYITDLRHDSVRTILARLRRLIPRYLLPPAACVVTALEGIPASDGLKAASDDG